MGNDATFGDTARSDAIVESSDTTFSGTYNRVSSRQPTESLEVWLRVGFVQQLQRYDSQ